MAFNSLIVDQINQSLGEGILSALQPARFYGLATVNPARDKTQSLPGIVSLNGEITVVNPDDDYCLQVYHRNLSNQYGISAQSYGRENTITCASENLAFIFAKGDLLQLTADDLEGFFVVSFPEAVEADPIGACTITLLSSSTEKSATVKSEFGKPDFLKPEQHFFSIRYRVTFSFTKECLTEYLSCLKN